jgi:hypothetical protein
MKFTAHITKAELEDLIASQFDHPPKSINLTSLEDGIFIKFEVV